jgi:hypothetical protein
MKWWLSMTKKGEEKGKVRALTSHLTKCHPTEP